MTWTGLVAILALATLAAGCLAPGGGPSAAPTAPPEGPARPAPVPGLVLGDCVGWHAFATVPAPLHPGVRPDGWAPPAGADASVALLGLRCGRLALGPFERGPVWLLFESHTNAVVPAACADDREGATDLSVLASVWVDDAEVAGWLAAVHGMPAAAAVFTDAGQAWSWGPAGAAPSELQVLDGSAAPRDAEHGERFFWANGTGLGQLELRHERTGPTVPLAAAGRMAPPMLLAQVADGRFAGPASWFPQDEASGAFQAYRDTLCLEAA
ncbi:MAG: hypothetical protein QOD77_1126 [Thermoplasmata archaeon]|jgi:hypothetical protein|nr:hypothetical protein [Thermoplasmata archaeon]